MSGRTRTGLVGALLGVLLLMGACGSSSRREVVIPARAQQTDIAGAYDLLHALGLRVEIPGRLAISALRDEWATRLVPRPGTRVPVGGTVKIEAAFGPITSVSVLKTNPHFLVPNFAGLSASAAIRWAERHSMFWSIPRLPALPPSSAKHLFDAYRILTQRPQPGQVIRQGLRIGQSYEPTPLTLVVALKSVP